MISYAIYHPYSISHPYFNLLSSFKQSAHLLQLARDYNDFKLISSFVVTSMGSTDPIQVRALSRSLCNLPLLVPYSHTYNFLSLFQYRSRHFSFHLSLILSLSLSLRTARRTATFTLRGPWLSLPPSVSSFTKFFISQENS